jgi:hypothetical protein
MGIMSKIHVSEATPVEQVTAVVDAEPHTDDATWVKFRSEVEAVKLMVESLAQNEKQPAAKEKGKEIMLL